MQICGHWWVKMEENCSLSKNFHNFLKNVHNFLKNVHNFLKNFPQAMLACLRPFPCLVHCFDKCEYLGMYWQESLDKYQILVLSSVRIKWPCIVIGMISTWFTIHYQVSVSVILIQISISASLVIRNHRSCDAPSLLWGTHIGMRHPHCYEAPSLVWGTLIVMK